MDYLEFLKQKQKNVIKSGFDVNDSDLNSNLFDFQKFIVKRALKLGKYAIFAECGLGKTLMQLEWAYQVTKKTNGKVLILCPLAVKAQTIQEGNKFNIDLSNIEIYNYEQLDNVNINNYVGVVLDESSILKNFTGKYRNEIINICSNLSFKLACTATPSPNDEMELGNHAEFLNQMSRNEMLSMFFVHDGGDTSKWRLKGHAIKTFYSWISSWATMITTPSDIGFSDNGYILPNLNIKEFIIETEKRSNSTLFNEVAINALSYNQELKNTMEERIKKVAEIVNNSNEQFIIWIKQNEEEQVIKKLIPDAVIVSGSDKIEYKENKLLGFANNDFRVLVTKSKIAQFGLNYQNCNNQIFASLDFSYESLHQSIRRSYRFGQKNEVNIYIITTDTMRSVSNILKNKTDKFQEMKKNMNNLIDNVIKNKTNNFSDPIIKEDYQIYNNDCIEQIKNIPDNSIHFSIFSPPFADLYTYSDLEQDMGNSKDYNEFMIHFEFLAKELYRILKNGRNVAIHCMDLPIQKGKEGYIGLRDFSGMIINLFTKIGFIYHDRITIWKDPVVEMQRTKALGLLHKQVKKDSSMSRTGIPDYLLVFRKEGINEEPITNINISVDLWQKYASPVWYDINYSDTLQFRTARSNEDEKHICPLQLQTIERAIHLWSNPSDVVFTPFMGIGSEVYQSIKMNRKAIGIELKNAYFELAKKNIELAIAENKQISLF